MHAHAETCVPEHTHEHIHMWRNALDSLLSPSFLSSVNSMCPQVSLALLPKPSSIQPPLATSCDTGPVHSTKSPLPPSLSPSLPVSSFFSSTYSSKVSQINFYKVQIPARHSPLFSITFKIRSKIILITHGAVWPGSRPLLSLISCHSDHSASLCSSTILKLCFKDLVSPVWAVQSPVSIRVVAPTEPQGLRSKSCCQRAFSNLLISASLPHCSSWISFWQLP